MAVRTDSAESHLSPSDTLSMRDLERATGLSARTIQFWTLMDVLKPSHATSHPGRGRTRQYPVDEVAVARSLLPVYRLGVPTRLLVGVAEAVRGALREIDAQLGRAHTVRLTFDGDAEQWTAAIVPSEADAAGAGAGPAVEVRFAVDL